MAQTLEAQARDLARKLFELDNLPYDPEDGVADARNENFRVLALELAAAVLEMESLKTTGDKSNKWYVRR